jgi:hypothetical protein
MRAPRSFLPCCVVVVLASCGGEAAPATPPAPAATAPTPAAAPTATTGPAAVAPVPSSPPEPEGDPVELLHAIPTSVAVSSAYRDDPAQVARLVDGDLETAWNSRTGELAGAWIDVSLPAEATVTAIALTAGFTHRTASSDLFEGNHRVSRVRVLRDGVEVAAQDLDVASRALQSIPVRGAGGVYRVEVASVVAGSRPDWRETCISELRVMGHAPGASPGSATPRTAIGALPSADAPAVAAVPIAPALPAGPMPPRFATLAATLSAAGVTRLFRVDDVFGPLRQGGDRVSAIVAADASGTWLCVSRSFDTRCVVVASGAVSVHQPHDHADAVSVAYLGEDRFWVTTELPASGAPTASRRAERAPIAEATPLPAPAMREPPSWLAALEGLEIVSGYRTLAAAAGGWLTVCDVDDGAVTCPPPVSLDPLRREHLTLSETTLMFGETHSVGFEWWARDDDAGREESGQGSVFVHVGDAVALRATVINAMDVRVPSTEERGAIDVVEMECFDADMMTETCLQSGPPSGERRREDEDGDERPLGSVTFQRAPDEIPATGIGDPLAISIEGAWTILPDGGLRRRTRRCPEE